MKHFWKTRKLDFILLVGALICFIAFGVSSYLFRYLSGIEGPIPEQTDGSAERKPSGTNIFIPSEKGTLFYNMDAVWVGKGKSSTLKLDHGTEFKLGEKTLIILKKPFKRSIQVALKDQVQLVKGTLTDLRDDVNSKKKTQENNKLPELPDANEIEARTRGNGRDKAFDETYPVMGGVLLSKRPIPLTLLFKWVSSETGFLVVRHRVSGRANFIPISSQKQAVVTFSEFTTYDWQVIGEDRRVRAGPYTFDLLPLTTENEKVHLRSVERPIDILFDGS